MYYSPAYISSILNLKRLEKLQLLIYMGFPKYQHKLLAKEFFFIGGGVILHCNITLVSCENIQVNCPIFKCLWLYSPLSNSFWICMISHLHILFLKILLLQASVRVLIIFNFFFIMNEWDFVCLFLNVIELLLMSSSQSFYTFRKIFEFFVTFHGSCYMVCLFELVSIYLMSRA